MIRLATILLVIGFLTASVRAEPACRQALALGLDISGSVDAREYRLQLDGLAAALKNDKVRAAFAAIPGAPVHLAIYIWSAPEHQVVILPWTVVDGPGTLDRITRQLETRARSPAPKGTAIGSALETGAAMLLEKSGCWSLTLDLSGDGKNNLGPHPRDVVPGLAARGITVNALVIGADAPTLGDIRQMDIAELSAYFRAHVITGPDAFVQTALGFGDYEAAMVRKLLRELRGQILAGPVWSPPDQ